MSLETFSEQLATDKDLQDHFRRAKISSPKSYLGKEHFWKYAVERGIDEFAATQLYLSVTYPRVVRPHRSGREVVAAIDPAAIGLIVATRAQIHLDLPPEDSIAQLLRVYYRHDDIDRVVRADSVVQFADRVGHAGDFEDLKLVAFSPDAWAFALEVASLVEKSYA